MTQRPTDAPVRLGRYELLGEIASGGMATVFLARASGAGGFTRLVAIKRLHPHLEAEEEFVRMFLDEARLAARIRHPNVVGTLDVEDRDGLYLVMEFIEGVTLLQLSREAQRQGERVPAPVAVRIALDTLAGLHAAHELRDEHDVFLNLVHRDVSPQNILLGLDGTARLTDFGIAKAHSRLSLTRDGQLKGKVSYMAPEQTRRGEALDRRADVFAMGAVVWELLAGRRLFHGESDVEVLNQLLFEPMPRLRDFAPTLPSMLEAVVTKALERDAAARYATAAQFAEALERATRMLGGAANHRVVAAFVQRVAGERIARERTRISLGSVPPGAPLTGSLRASLTPAPTLSTLRPASNPHAERPSAPRAKLRAPTITGPVYAPASCGVPVASTGSVDVPVPSLRAHSRPSVLRPPTLPGASPQGDVASSEFIPTVPPPPSPALPAVIEFDISEDPDAAPVPTPSPLRAATRPGFMPTPIPPSCATLPTATSQGDDVPFPPIELSYQHIPALSAPAMPQEIDPAAVREFPEGASPSSRNSPCPTPIDSMVGSAPSGDAPTASVDSMVGSAPSGDAPTASVDSVPVPPSGEAPSVPIEPAVSISELPPSLPGTQLGPLPVPTRSPPVEVPPLRPPSRARAGLRVALALTLVVLLGIAVGLRTVGILPPVRGPVADTRVRLRPSPALDVLTFVDAVALVTAPASTPAPDAVLAVADAHDCDASSLIERTVHEGADGSGLGGPAVHEGADGTSVSQISDGEDTSADASENGAFDAAALGREDVAHSALLDVSDAGDGTESMAHDGGDDGHHRRRHRRRHRHDHDEE